MNKLQELQAQRNKYYEEINNNYTKLKKIKELALKEYQPIFDEIKNKYGITSLIINNSFSWESFDLTFQITHEKYPNDEFLICNGYSGRFPKIIEFSRCWFQDEEYNLSSHFKDEGEIPDFINNTLNKAISELFGNMSKLDKELNTNFIDLLFITSPENLFLYGDYFMTTQFNIKLI